MAANPIKEKRLSEDSTASSDASVSASIESADGSGANTDDSSVGSAPIEKTADELAAEEEEKYVTWLESDPTIAGRYTNDDPNYANNRERLTPPLVLDYNPRVYNRGGRGRGGGGGGGGGGGRQDNFQNRGRAQGNYGQSSSYEHKSKHRHHNQQGLHGQYPQQRQPEQQRYAEKRNFGYGELPDGASRKRPAAPSYQSEESD